MKLHRSRRRRFVNDRPTLESAILSVPKEERVRLLIHCIVIAPGKGAGDSIVIGYAGPKESNNFYDCGSNNTGCSRIKRGRKTERRRKGGYKELELGMYLRLGLDWSKSSALLADSCNQIVASLKYVREIEKGED